MVLASDTVSLQMTSVSMLVKERLIWQELMLILGLSILDLIELNQHLISTKGLGQFQMVYWENGILASRIRCFFHVVIGRGREQKFSFLIR